MNLWKGAIGGWLIGCAIAIGLVLAINSSAPVTLALGFTLSTLGFYGGIFIQLGRDHR